RRAREPHKPVWQDRRTDLPFFAEWVETLGEWVTTRQASLLLHTTQRSVSCLRESGRLIGVKRKSEQTHRVQWHYRKADVLTLQADPRYCRRRRVYEEFRSPEAQERHRAEAFARELALCREAMERKPPDGVVGEWLQSYRW